MKIFVSILVIFSFLISCKKNKVNPDSVISMKSYYRTDPTTGDTIFAFHIPTGFTPNGDGINETWEPKAFKLSPTGYIEDIFGKDGSVIFETKTLAPFNGKPTGGKELLQEGTYGYYIEANDTLRTTHFFKGQFIIIK
jgi:gliding motility-associated-like protein